MTDVVTEHDAPESAERRSSRSGIYPHVMRAVLDTPWAIRPAVLELIVEVAVSRDAGVRASADEISERVAAAGQRRSNGGTGGAIAVISLMGVIMPRADAFAQMSGAASLERFQTQLQQALGDPDIGGILLEIDSPGGSVDLVTETAAMIREGAKRKPIYAIANAMAASAAYCIASQATQLIVTPSGMVGSIGVIAAHEDWSGFNEKIGLKVTYITAGEGKADGNPDEPLSDDAKAHVQGIVNEFYGTFVADVARGRKVDAKVVREEFAGGTARMVTAKTAVKQNMADAVDTFSGAIRRLSQAITSGGSGTGARTNDVAVLRSMESYWLDRADSLSGADLETARTELESVQAQLRAAGEEVEEPAEREPQTSDADPDGEPREPVEVPADGTEAELGSDDPEPTPAVDEHDRLLRRAAFREHFAPAQS